MTPIYALLIITYTCPFKFAWVPPMLRPMVGGCEKQEEVEEYTSAAKAMDRVRELGPGSTFVLMESDTPIILRKVEWEPTVGKAR
jgi:hypothetical protein